MGNTDDAGWFNSTITRFIPASATGNTGLNEEHTADLVEAFLALCWLGQHSGRLYPTVGDMDELYEHVKTSLTSWTAPSVASLSASIPKASPEPVEVWPAPVATTSSQRRQQKVAFCHLPTRGEVRHRTEGHLSQTLGQSRLPKCRRRSLAKGRNRERILKIRPLLPRHPRQGSQSPPSCAGSSTGTRARWPPPWRASRMSSRRLRARAR